MPQQATVVMPTAATGRRVERRFYIGMALAAILLSVAGFGPSIIDPSRRRVPLPLTPLVTTHAIVSGAYLLLFLTQATLVAAGRTAVHRRMGIVGAMLAVAWIVLGYVTSIQYARRGFDLSGDVIGQFDVPGTLVFQLGDLVSFGILVAAGFWFRRRPDIHKRLMLLATVTLMLGAPPAHLIGHWPSLHGAVGSIIALSVTIPTLSASIVSSHVIPQSL